MEIQDRPIIGHPGGARANPFGGETPIETGDAAIGWASLIEMTRHTIFVEPSSQDAACDVPRREFEAPLQ